jgi:hypothetical protein
LVLFSVPGPAAAQGMGGQGMGMGRMYDPKTVETLSGEIVAIKAAQSGMPGVANRVTLDLKTAKETVAVYLGPEDYYQKQNVKLAQGDKVEIKGSRVTMGGHPVIIPNYVKKGDQVLKLWDDQGMPPWSRAKQ